MAYLPCTLLCGSAGPGLCWRQGSCAGRAVQAQLDAGREALLGVSRRVGSSGHEAEAGGRKFGIGARTGRGGRRRRACPAAEGRLREWAGADGRSLPQLLEENDQLIRCIVEYQSKGRATDCVQYQHILHRNLIYLATIADAAPPSSQKTVD
ncbi:PREDICTED: SS18-like protein 2 [Tinamus guttatus]|nr:PREDICTED: SS18-like protein 2 [Tinamus guttatus]